MSSENAETHGAKRKFGKILLGTLAALVIGAIGNGLWELIFRPGFSSTGSWITTIWRTTDNAIFESAALDPTPLPALVLLIVGQGLIVGAMFIVIFV